MTSEGPSGPGFSPYYSWIGSPASFNGTNTLTGGDSCKLLPFLLRRLLIRCAHSHRQGHGNTANNFSINFLTGANSRRESESMVHLRRSVLHHRGLGHGGGHDTGPGFPLLRFGPPKIGTEHDLGLYGFILRHHLPMVLLGLLAGFLRSSDQRLYWQPRTFRFDQHTRRP